ncbi:unnamed protein product [Allacma fusca]|uniref:Ubiquitin-like domain-containing protein n=1 Tax=Allacma fusca TaxID=39272 RepID=A0A8J2KB54_9HEXA|nr:unnamed protein product [Allacma fusca]
MVYTKRASIIKKSDPKEDQKMAATVATSYNNNDPISLPTVSGSFQDQQKVSNVDATELCIPADTDSQDNLVETGLEVLFQVDEIYVKKEPFQQGRYILMNGNGDAIFTALLYHEDECLGQYRSFIMSVARKTEDMAEPVEIFDIRRRRACESVALRLVSGSMFGNNISLNWTNGKIAGKILQLRHSCRPTFEAQNALGRKILKIQGGWGGGSCNPLWASNVSEFDIFASSSALEPTGIIKKHLRPFNFTSEQRMFGANFPSDLDPLAKVLIIGALFQLNITYFERKFSGLDMCILLRYLFLIAVIADLRPILSSSILEAAEGTDKILDWIVLIGRCVCEGLGKYTGEQNHRTVTYSTTSSTMGDAEVSSSTSVSAKKPKNETSEGDGEPNEAQSGFDSAEKLNKGPSLNTVELSILKTGTSLESEISTSGIHIDEQLCTKEDPLKEPVEEVEVELKVIFNKQPLPIRIALNKTIGNLKKMVESLTGVSPALQKVVVRGIPSDDTALSTLGLSQGSKVLVIGTKLDEVLKMSKPVVTDLKEKEEAKKKADQNWSQLPQHRKIIDKGVPENAMGGILNEREPLPSLPLHGMVSSKGSKVRLTFKLANDELWIGTKERTDKVPIQSIRNVVSQPITGFEHYHIMAIQLGPTEASRFYVYWVPAQYVDAIKEVLNG